MLFHKHHIDINMYNLKCENLGGNNDRMYSIMNDKDAVNSFDMFIKDKVFCDNQIFYFDTIESIYFVLALFLNEINGMVLVDSGDVVNQYAFFSDKIKKIGNFFGKIDLVSLEKAVRGNTHPLLVYLNNTTQYGIMYSEQEIEIIYRFCKSKNILLYINGDRLANAISDWGILPFSLQKYCDILSIGGTRYGMLFGCLCIVSNPQIKIAYYAAKAGIVFENTLLIKKQFYVLLCEENYAALGDAVNKLAYRLQTYLKKVLPDKVVELSTNHVKTILSKKQNELCSSRFLYNIVDELPDGEVSVEFVTNWQTTEEMLRMCVKLISM